MSFVVDASITLGWYFDDEATPAADELLDRLASNGAVVPALRRLEVGNACQIAMGSRATRHHSVIEPSSS